MRDCPGMEALVGRTVQLDVGGLAFRVEGLDVPLHTPRSHGYAPFLSQAGPPAAGQATPVQVSVLEAWTPRGRLLFDTGSRWSAWEQGPAREIVFFEMEDDGGRWPSFLLRFRPEGGEVELRYLPRLLQTQGVAGALRNPFHYPADQLLAMYRLGGRGLMLHAAGLDTGAGAVACAGVSGTGKTTFTRLAEGRGWRPLTDERVIVRLDGPARPVLHGTPWLGEGHWAENRALPLRALVFLEQGPAHEARALTPTEALPRLLRTVSIPWFDPQHVGEGLGACEQALRRVPAVVLAFRREPGAVDALAELLASAG